MLCNKQPKVQWFIQYLFLIPRPQGWFGQVCLKLGSLSSDMLFNSNNISYRGHVFHMVKAEEQDVRSNQANIFRASAHVMSTIVPLAKASHVTEAEAHEARTSTLPTLLAIPAKS